MLMPPAIAFCLDSEYLSNNKKKDLLRASKAVHFLPRRMSEIFLLDPPAIAAVANQTVGFRAQPIREDGVQALIDAKRADRHCYCQGTQEVPVDWITQIDGARILREIFAELSGSQVSFEKMRHSVAITDWILQNRKEHFRDLANWIGELIPGAQ